eukprot:16439183-Heterocapsa_arctica.AAC.1
MKCGIDMGAGASPLLFAIAMDPLLWSLRAIPQVTRHDCYQAYLSPCDDWHNKILTLIKGCSFQDLAIQIKAHWIELKYSDTPLPDTWGVFIDQIFIPGAEIIEWATAGRRTKDTHKPYSCKCSCNVMVVPSRPLTPPERALVDDTPWGAA